MTWDLEINVVGIARRAVSQRKHDPSPSNRIKNL